jgi:Tfp pilus assembly protein PilF
MIKYILFGFLFVNTLFAASNKNIEDLHLTQNKLQQILWFNKGVLELKNNQFNKAEYFFKKTLDYNKLPSILNIAIIKYKQKKYPEAIKLFKLLSTSSTIDENLYIYLSANIYLFYITKSHKYLKKIKSNFSIIMDSNDRSKMILADTYIQLGHYKKAALIISQGKNIDYYKKAILEMINGNLEDAKKSLKILNEEVFEKKQKLLINWFLLYIDLKTGKLSNLSNMIETLDDNKDTYYPNDTFPISLEINPNRYSQSYYLNNLKKLSINDKIDLVFYFSSYKFSDESQIEYTQANSFFLFDEKMLFNLTKMTGYNKNLINDVLKDPYILKQKLKKYKFEDQKSYMHYNLGLICANLGEYKDALKQFNIAYNLKPGNKIYAVYTLLCAKRINKNFKAKKELQGSISSSQDANAQKAQVLNNLLIKNKQVRKGQLYGIDDNPLGEFIEYLTCKGKACLDISFFDDTEDPIKKLLYSVVAYQNRSNLALVSAIQDNLVKEDLSKFPLIIHRLYAKYLKAVGLDLRFKDFIIKSNDLLQSEINYLYTMYQGKNDSKINKIFLDNTINHDMMGKETLYAATAAILQSSEEDEEAFINISMINNLYKDNNSDFLIGIRYLKSKDFNKALDRFKKPYTHEYIDFEISGLKKLIKEL